MQPGARSFIILLLALAAMACLMLGLTLPVVKLTRLFFWQDRHSLSSVVVALWYTDETFLAAVVVLSSFILPVVKLVYLTAAATLLSPDSIRESRWLSGMEWLGRWAMLDVLVIALVIFYAKSSELSDAVALPGVYFFAASVILTMIAYGLVQPGKVKEPAASGH